MRSGVSHKDLVINMRSSGILTSLREKNDKWYLLKKAVFSETGIKNQPQIEKPLPRFSFPNLLLQHHQLSQNKMKIRFAK